MSAVDRTDGEIDWPAQFERTPAAERQRTSKFSVTFNEAIEDIQAELLDRVGAQDWRISTAAAHRKDDGMPYANANPTDPGVVVRWTKDGKQYAVACDHYTDWRDNARAIGLYIREKRKMSNRPVVTGHDEFATARLPPGNEEAIVSEVPPHEVLEVNGDASPAVIKAAAREKIKEHHPDRGGDPRMLQRVKSARDELLERVEETTGGSHA